MPPTPSLIELVPVTALLVHPENAREGDIGAIAESISANGWAGALVVQRSTGHILVGNHRYQAAVMLGFTALPVEWVDCSDDEARQRLLIDNAASDRATYESQQLLAALAATDTLTGTGWTDEEVHEVHAIVHSEPVALQQNEKQWTTTEVDISSSVLHHTCPHCGFEFDEA